MQITVDPNSVRAYGTAAQEIFGAIRHDLEGLVSDVVNVDYKGENAVDFKTRSGQLAADFATALTADLRAIADAVQSSTTNITQALGGGPVVIQFNGGAVSVPAVPQGDGTYSADPSGLEALKGVARNRFGSITEQLNAHLSRLTSTAWSGNAKEQAVQAVTTFTNNARAKVDEASSNLTGYIDRQLEALRAADK